MRALAHERQVVLDVEVLNECAMCGGTAPAQSALRRERRRAVCRGWREPLWSPTPRDGIFVGENPVIDVVLPDDVTDGYLTVSILDVSGNVFHLLPNISRSRITRCASLREAETSGKVPVRVAYSLEESESQRRHCLQGR